MRFRNPACPLTPAQAEKRGLAWVVGAFVICPCHLPVTLAVFGTLLAGTAAGAVFRGHLVLAGAVISIAWLAATWHGFRLMRAGEQARAALRITGDGSRTAREPRLVPPTSK